MHTSHAIHDHHPRLRRTLAVTLAAGLMLPAAIAVAKPAGQSDPAQTRPTAAAEAPRRGPIARPAAQVDTVYRGALDGALGTHTWSGDLFGTGMITHVTYDIVLDEAGVPLVTGIVVDESSLPAGATYELRESTNRTSGEIEDSAGHEPKADEPKGDEPADESPGEEPTPVEVVVPVDEDTTTTTVVEDTSTADAETSTMTFASRSGVKFSMEGRWAGLLLLAHGRLGDDPVIAVRTLMVSPPAERPDPVGETTTTSTIAVPTEDEPDKPERGQDERGDADRDARKLGDRDQDRDRARQQRGDDRGNRGDDLGDRGRDKPPTGS